MTGCYARKRASRFLSLNATHFLHVQRSDMHQQQIKRAEVLSPSQIRHLLRVTAATSRHPERDAVILLLGLGCGMRITEIAQVTVADFYFSTGELRREISLRAAITKGCRQRCIFPSSPKLIAALQRYVAYRGGHDMGTAFGRTEYHGLNPHLPLILSRKGYPYALSLKRRSDAQGAWTDYWAADSLQAYVTGLYRAAGTNGTSHSGRRTFATRLLGSGATIEQVQLLLGHEDIDQTSRYIEVSAADATRAFSEVI
jgi:integrase/recombinase XerD